MTSARTEAKPQKAMYSFGYESKARSLNGFSEMFDAPDFEERRARLVAGLDNESVAAVNRIFQRLKIILHLKEGETADLYTKEEQKAFDESKCLLQDKIVQLAPDLFVWNGYALPRKHFEPNVFLDGYGFRFIETLGSIGDKAIIDAGAYIGDSALMLAPLTTGKVYAFEPMLENFRHLEKTVWLNGLENVVPVQRGLGDCKGTLTISVGNIDACATVQNNLPDGSLKQESVEVVRLDDFVRDEGVHVGLIKTDVEGAEQMLLRGARETIERDRPILLVSIYHNASDFLDIKPMIESWNLGYRFQIYHPPIRSISGETVLIAECNRRLDGYVSTKPLPELATANRSLWQKCADLAAGVVSAKRKAEIDRANARAKVAQLLEEKRKVEADRVSARAKVSQLIEEKRQAETGRANALAKVSQLIEEKKQAEATCASTRAKVSQLIEEKKQAEATCTRARAKVSQLIEEKRQAEAGRANALAKVSQLIEEKKQSEATCTRARAKVSQLIEEKRQAEADRANALTKATQLLAEKRAVESDRALARNKVTMLIGQKKELEAGRRKLESDNHRLEKDVKALREKADRLDGLIRNMERIMQ